MFPQKIHLIPEIQEADSSSPKPLVFWKRIKQNQEKELHLLMLLEGRTEKETQELGRDFWEMISSYTNELVMNKTGFFNPEHICEAILKIGNEFFTKWGRINQINNWGDINLIIAVASPQAVSFTRLGNSHLLLFRNKQIILADENLSHPRSPSFSPPFSEIAGGTLKLGDKFLLASKGITESFSWEEISSLVLSKEITQAFYNIVRSVEVLVPPRNVAFALGDVVPSGKEDEPVNSLLKNKRIKETRIGELIFTEFNFVSLRQLAVVSSEFVLWREVLKAIRKKIAGGFNLVFKLFGFLLKPFRRKINSLSLTRKIIIFSSLALFSAFLGLLAYSIVTRSRVPVSSPPQKDYKAMYEEAEKLKEEAANALIYQDEEKSRKNLAEADSLLEQVSESGEWGIKAIKLRQDLSDQLVTLDKAQKIEVQKIWTVPENQESIKKIGIEKNRNILVATDKGIWNIDLSKEASQAEKFPKDLSLNSKKCWLVPIKNEFLLLSGEDNSYFIVNPQNKEISEKKELSSFKFTAVSSFDAFIYFFDSERMQIKQFNYANGELLSGRDWLKQDLSEESQNSPAASMSVDGSVYVVTQKGDLFNFSGGKKTTWNAEKPGSLFQGEKLMLFTKPEDKDLFLLDPDKKRIVVFEKETGSLKGQMQNTNFGQATDFQVDEGNKTIYFTTPNELFKLNFKL